MKDYEQFESTVLKYIKDNFTAPFFIKTDDYEIGTVLYTANPYYRTNATIIDITKSIGTFYTVLTDIGNILYENKKTLEENYLPPVCKRTNSLPKDNEEYFELPSFGKIPIYTSGYVKWKTMCLA